MNHLGMRTPHTTDSAPSSRSLAPRSADEVAVERLRVLAGDAFAELQRGDAKAAAACGTAGAGLGAVIAAVSAAAHALPLGAVIGLWCAGACFVLSIGQCLSAVRPSLRAGNRRRPACYLDCAGTTTDELLAVVAGLTTADLARAESRRATELSFLAHTKFRMLRRATLLSQLALTAASLGALTAFVDAVAEW
ncbi:Pycsar system effector family protein [Streptomyces syringium]|uniref:Pycsar system effector family protein n=2 Tax=Streptomyces syringium TaxID=76729 RepID=UPI0036E3D9A6